MLKILPWMLLLAWKHPPELIRDLSDDSAEVRDRASAELYRLGEDVRAPLMDAHLATSDAELRCRIQSILRRLDADERIRCFGGGNRVAGFAMSLRTDRFFGSGPFRLTVEVMNVSPKEQDFPGIGTWDLELPDQEIRSTRPEARITLRRIGGPLGLRRTTWKSGPTEVPSPVHLRPGESARYEYTLEARTLPPGDYQVSVEYFARDRLPDAAERLRTNSSSLMVRR